MIKKLKFCTEREEVNEIKCELINQKSVFLNEKIGYENSIFVSYMLGEKIIKNEESLS